MYYKAKESKKNRMLALGLNLNRPDYPGGDSSTKQLVNRSVQFLYWDEAQWRLVANPMKNLLESYLDQGLTQHGDLQIKTHTDNTWFVQNTAFSAKIPIRIIDSLPEHDGASVEEDRVPR